MVDVKFYIINSPERKNNVKAFYFQTELPARPMKGDTFMFNETIRGLEEMGPDEAEFLHSNEFGIQSTVWTWEDGKPVLEVTLEQVL